MTKDTASSRAFTAQMRQNTYGLEYGHPPNKGLIMAKKSTHHLQYADFAFAASATTVEGTSKPLIFNQLKVCFEESFGVYRVDPNVKEVFDF